jgi:hypothetical protein
MFAQAEAKKSMRAFFVFPGGCLCCIPALGAPSRAEPLAPAAIEQERYAMTPAEGGLLRLDRQSGSVSFCAAKDGQAVCRAGADESAGLEAEISRLTQENDELRKKQACAPALPPKGSSALRLMKSSSARCPSPKGSCGAAENISRGGAGRETLSRCD